MASMSQTILQLPPLAKQKMARLIAGAKRTGVSPQDYAKKLVEEALDIQHLAEQMTFAEIVGPIRRAAGKVTDAEIVALVKKARSRRQEYRRQTKRD